MTRLEYIPPMNWAGIDLARELEPQVDTVVRRLTAELKDVLEAEDAAPQGPQPAHGVRDHLRTQVLASLEGLRDKGGALYLLEADPVAGVRTGASLAFLPMPVAAGDDPLDYLLAIAAQTPGAHVFEFGSMVALRTTQTSDPTAQMEEELARLAPRLGEQTDATAQASEELAQTPISRWTTTYYLGDPADTSSWYIAVAEVSLPATAEGEELGKALHGLTDSIIRSVRIR